MATRRPLVVINGDISELPVGDSVAGSAASAFQKGVAEIDFGSFSGSNEASVVVTSQTGIQQTSSINLKIKATSQTIDHSQNDHLYALAMISLTVGTIVDNTSFEIKAVSLNKMQGTFEVSWEWL